MRAELESLEARLNYRFSDPAILLRALTHSSHANEARTSPGSSRHDNEQLEFLGDSILGFLVAEALMERFPEYHEGELSRVKAHLVSAAHLYGVARRLDLGSHLELGRSEEMSGGRAKKTLLVDALEAVIAAMYLDGGMEPVRHFVAAPLPISRAPFRNWRRRANCRTRAMSSCGSAGRSIPRCLPWKRGSARNGPRRPRGGPRRSRRSARRGACTSGWRRSRWRVQT